MSFSSYNHNLSKKAGVGSRRQAEKQRRAERRTGKNQLEKKDRNRTLIQSAFVAAIIFSLLGTSVFEPLWHDHASHSHASHDHASHSHASSQTTSEEGSQSQQNLSSDSDHLLSHSCGCSHHKTVETTSESKNDSHAHSDSHQEGNHSPHQHHDDCPICQHLMLKMQPASAPVLLDSMVSLETISAAEPVFIFLVKRYSLPHRGPPAKA